MNKFIKYSVLVCVSLYRLIRFELLVAFSFFIYYMSCESTLITAFAIMLLVYVLLCSIPKLYKLFTNKDKFLLICKIFCFITALSFVLITYGGRATEKELDFKFEQYYVILAPNGFDINYFDKFLFKSLRALPTYYLNLMDSNLSMLDINTLNYKSYDNLIRVMFSSIFSVMYFIGIMLEELYIYWFIESIEREDILNADNYVQK